VPYSRGNATHATLLLLSLDFEKGQRLASGRAGRLTTVVSVRACSRRRRFSAPSLVGAARQAIELSDSTRTEINSKHPNERPRQATAAVAVTATLESSKAHRARNLASPCLMRRRCGLRDHFLVAVDAFAAAGEGSDWRA